MSESSTAQSSLEKPKFSPGQTVKVIQGYPIGHYRTPTYFRESIGVIERCCGAFANPEELAYGRCGLPKINLYRVRARLRDIWPHYDQQSKDSIEVEIYEHWLESVSMESHALDDHSDGHEGSG